MTGRPDAGGFLRIGPFAKQANLSPHQLRHYHELGLLTPALVDPESGYRYYADAQAATAEVIAILRSVDMPLGDIKDLLRDPSRERVQTALDRQRARLEGRLAEAREKLERLEQLAEEGRLMSEQRETGPVVEVIVDGVRLHTPTSQHAVLLREKDADRVLCIWVGPFEANGIASRLHHLPVARPLTHDLMSTALDHFGVDIDRVVITARAAEVFYAAIHAHRNEQAEVLDARPSDALNVALRARAPIFVGAAVMDECATAPPAAETVPAPPTTLVTAFDADTEQPLGLLSLKALPAPGQTVPVCTPTEWHVVSVEPGDGEHLPRVLVRRPGSE